MDGVVVENKLTMDDSVNVSTISDKREPLNVVPPPTPRLNDRLKTEHMDLDRNDVSCGATATRGTANLVANWFTPQQVIGILRLLKAVTFCFLILTMVADLMYVLFVEIMSSKEYRAKAGGYRDVMIRIYGLAFAVIIVCIELEVRSVAKRFLGLKPFIPRGLMMLFVAVITGSHPKQDSNSKHQYDDDAAAAGDDDGQDYMLTNLSQDYQIPKSALAFQMVTSYAL